MTIIRDPLTGDGARVNGEGKLRVYAVVESELLHASEEAGLSFAWSNVSYDYTAADTILLIQNTSTTRLLHICCAWVGGDTASLVTFHMPTVATPTGTAVTGVNMNGQSGNVAEASAKANESTNSQANIVHQVQIVAAVTLPCDFRNAIVLGLNDSFAVDFAANGAAAYVTVWGYYHV